METLSSLFTWFRDSISFKLITIGFIVIVLLIPSSMIKNLVSEREQRRNETISEIHSKWGYPQNICGPVISIPFKEKVMKDGKTEEHIEYAHFMPEKLDISCELIPEIRYRGIFKVIVYTAKIKSTGNFSDFNFGSLDVPVENVIWNDAYFSIGIPDTRGISRQIIINWNGKEYGTSPGIKSKDVLATGVSVKIPVINDTAGRFEFDMEINGSELISFVPVGKETNVSMISTWNAPSFDGAFLPKSKEIDKNGFKATWKILEVNLDYPERWIGRQYIINKPLSGVSKPDYYNVSNEQSSSFGVRLIYPVDFYQLSMRSVKYAVLFILLTFVSLFFAEFTSKKKIHPVQYLLTGAAISVFYILLLSLSEQIGFEWAYAIAASAILAMVLFYTRSAFKKWKPSMAVTGILATLYVYLFIILQLADYALLAGSIGLFIILGLVMYFSGKIDWYSGNIKNNK